MIDKKYIIALVFICIIGGVVALTWTGETTPPTTTQPNETPNESYGLNGTGYTTGELPAGITVDGIAPSTLVERYESQLAQSTFTLTTTRTEAVQNETKSIQTVYRKGINNVYITQSTQNKVIREEYYDRQSEVLYICDSSQTDKCPTSVTSYEDISQYGVPEVKSVFFGSSWQPQDVDDSKTYTEISLDSRNTISPQEMERTFKISNITNFSGQSTVDERQFITNLTAVIQGEYQSQAKTLRYTSELEAINQTTLEVPQWAHNTDNNYGAQRFGLSDDNRTLFVQNTKDGVYKPGSTVKISIDQGQTYKSVETTLGTNLNSGDTLYIAYADNQLYTSVDSAPEQQGDKLTDESYIIRVLEVDGQTEATKVEVVP